MTPDKLIEAAARAICLSQGQDPDAFDVARICGHNNAPLLLWQFYEEQARAAASIIIEACANEADECDGPFVAATNEEDNACDLMAKRIAHAIRALAPVKEDV